MGGTVNVFLRDKNRKLYKMHRWTNSLPFFLDHIGHADEDNHLSEYMDPWFKMQADWKKNKPSGPFEYHMTDCYFPSPSRICKGEYGLVFVDYITKTVISYQNYTSVGRVILASLEVSYEPEDLELFYDIVRKGQVSYFKFGQPNNTLPVVDLDHLSKIRNGGDDRIFFVIDNSPWHIEECDKDRIAFKEIKAKIDKILAQ